MYRLTKIGHSCIIYKESNLELKDWGQKHTGISRLVSAYKVQTSEHVQACHANMVTLIFLP
jgi:hypothetical protein